MKISLHYPMMIGTEEQFSTRAAVRVVAQEAERLGYGAINTSDHPAPSGKWRAGGGHDTFDPFAMLGFIAGCTERIRLHAHILVLPYRNPFLTAKAAASVDVLSDGRLTIGIGSGYMSSEYAALGVPFEERGALMDEALEVLALAWGEGPVHYRGRHFQAHGVVARPRPIQAPIPIWGGGNGREAVRRAARTCSGYSPFFAPPVLAKSARTEELSTLEDLRARLDMVREELERAERSGPFDICASVPHDAAVSGRTRESAERFVAAASAMAGMGANWVILSLPHTGLEDYQDTMRWAAEAILPQLVDL